MGSIGMGLGGLHRFGMFDPNGNSQGQTNGLFGGQPIQPTPEPLFGRAALLGPSANDPVAALIRAGGLSPLTLGLLAAAQADSKLSGIHKAFRTCLSNIELDATRATEASQHYNAIKNVIETRIPGAQMRRVGSFQRHTKIRPTTISGIASPIDIDALVCFGDATSMVSYGGLTGHSCLQIVQKALASNQIYRMLKPEIDHPVVTLSYANEFFIELIPSYRNRLSPEEWARDPASYLVCNSQNIWEHADYDYDSKYITDANKNTDEKLVPAIKLIKQFVRNRSIGLKSFQVELLCVKILVPYIQINKILNISWEWQDLLAHFLSEAPKFVFADLTMPGSRTSPPALLNPVELARVLKTYGDLFTILAKAPDNTNTLRCFKEAYGHRFPAS